MATTKKKSVAKKPVAKKKPAAKRPVVRSASAARRRPLISRSDEYSQLTWVLVCVWLVLIAIFVGTVVGQWG
jgi:hypothetical protein